MAEYDVAIVGFGPVGAVAACLLGQAGVRTLVVDRTDQIYDRPRAVALDHEIARVLQSLGIAEEIAPHLAPFTDSRFLGASGDVIKHLTMLPEPHPQGWTPSMVFMQPALEQILRNRATSHPSVTFELNRNVTGVTQDASGATLHFDDGVATARYIIGCDGASSTVRAAAGLALDDLGFDEPWLVVDVLANAKGLAKLPKTSVQYCEPARPTTFVMCTGHHRRWEIRLDESEDPRAMQQPDKVWALLSRWITPDDAELWRSASYRFHALVARQWRNDRIFIAGDAAHQQPPFLGQGLCQGVRDVANLSWRLISVLNGRGGEALLDSYGVERGAHVRRLTTLIKGIGGIVGERDLDKAKARDARLIAEAGGQVNPVPRQDLMPGLDVGLLSPVLHPARGALFPQPWVVSEGQRRRMDDVVGGGWRLVLAPETQVGADVVLAADALGATLIQPGNRTERVGEVQIIAETNGVLATWFKAQNVAAALVRPDNYVFGAGDDALAMLGAARAMVV